MADKQRDGKAHRKERKKGRKRSMNKERERTEGKTHDTSLAVTRKETHIYGQTGNKRYSRNAVLFILPFLRSEDAICRGKEEETLH